MIDLPQEVYMVLSTMASLDLSKRASIAQFLLTERTNNKQFVDDVYQWVF